MLFNLVKLSFNLVGRSETKPRLSREVSFGLPTKARKPSLGTHKGVAFDLPTGAKHLLRGVGLGLFDEAAAMEKFTKWSSEHDAHVAKRQGVDKKARLDKRNVPVVKKVEVAVPVADVPVEEVVDAPVAETPVAEQANPTAE